MRAQRSWRAWPCAEPGSRRTPSSDFPYRFGRPGQSPARLWVSPLSTPALRTPELAAQRSSGPAAHGRRSGTPSNPQAPHKHETPAAAGEPYPWIIRLLRYFDIALLALALPVFLVAGLPLLGWVAAAVGWVAQRAVRQALERRAASSGDPRTVAGITAGSMIARAWLLALAVFAVGMTEREAGLSAAVLVIVLFTAFFSTQIALRPFDRGSSA